MNITIINGRQNHIMELIAEKYYKETETRSGHVNFRQAEYSEITDKPDMLVITESGAKKAPPAGKKIRCGILLMPGDMDPDFIKADNTVRYGLSERDSVSLSSIKSRECVMAIKNEINALNGRKLEVQEIKIQRKGGMNLMDLMASDACVLLMGREEENAF